MPRAGVGPVLPSPPQSSAINMSAVATQLEMSAWPLIVTDPCSCRAMDPDVAPSISPRPGPHHGARWLYQLTSGCSSLPLSPQFFLSSLGPHPSLSLPFHHHLLAPLLVPGSRVSGVMSGMISECFTSLVHYGTGQGSFQALSASYSCLGVPGWCSSQVSSLSGS